MPIYDQNPGFGQQTNLGTLQNQPGVIEAKYGGQGMAASLPQQQQYYGAPQLPQPTQQFAQPTQQLGVADPQQLGGIGGPVSMPARYSGGTLGPAISSMAGSGTFGGIGDYSGLNPGSAMASSGGTLAGPVPPGGSAMAGSGGDVTSVGSGTQYGLPQPGMMGGGTSAMAGSGTYITPSVGSGFAPSVGQMPMGSSAMAGSGGNAATNVGSGTTYDATPGMMGGGNAPMARRPF